MDSEVIIAFSFKIQFDMIVMIRQIQIQNDEPQNYLAQMYYI